MNIVWYGQSCFRIQSKDITLVTDPFDKQIGLRPPFGAANIVTTSHDHIDHNNHEVLKGEYSIVDSAGEYEINKVVIKGIDSFHDNSEGKERGPNVIYKIEMEDMKICHLGDFGQEHFLNGQLEKIGQVDILFIPIGGTGTIDWKTAQNIINEIEPRIVIPMHFKIKGLSGEFSKLDTAEKFCKENGVALNDAVDKLSLKKKELPQDEAKVILMKLA